MVDTGFVIRTLNNICDKIEEQKDYLTTLDQPIGDSDHGINMARGFGKVREKLNEMADKDIGTILKTVGMILVSNVGGASGPLYGSAYMKSGMILIGKNEMDINDFIALTNEAIEAVKNRGKSVAEEATMLDAMIPSLNAMNEAVQGGLNAIAVLDKAVEAANMGAEHTKDLVATKGRASYVGERGLGHMDPGAASYTFMLEVVRDTLKGER